MTIQAANPSVPSSKNRKETFGPVGGSASREGAPLGRTSKASLSWSRTVPIRLHTARGWPSRRRRHYRTLAGVWPHPSTPPPNPTNLQVPEAVYAEGDPQPQLKEFAMNEKSQSELELQIVELGDAKEVTMGDPINNHGEDDLEVPGKF